MSKVDRRTYSPDPADQGAEQEVLVAHQRSDGTYVFGGNDGSYQENDDIGLYEDDPEPYEIELNHSRSRLLRNEVKDGLRKVDRASSVTLDCFNVAVMPEKLINAIEQVGKTQDSSFFDVIPILGNAGQEVAYVGLDQNSPYDFIVEPLVEDLIRDPQITIYAGDFIDIPDSFGHRIEAEYTHTYWDRAYEVVDGRIREEPHALSRLQILNRAFGGDFPHKYLFVSFGPRIDYAPEADTF